MSATTIVFFKPTTIERSKLKCEETCPLPPIYYCHPLVVPPWKKMRMSLDSVIRMMYQREHFQLIPLVTHR